VYVEGEAGPGSFVATFGSVEIEIWTIGEEPLPAPQLAATES
jgi:hypothetical protein